MSERKLANDKKSAATATSYLVGPRPKTVATNDGRILNVPPGWALLSPGDAGLTRRVKAAGLHWIVQEKRGRKTFSKGVWAPEKTIERIRSELAEERSTEQYAKRQKAAAQRRDAKQSEYVGDFQQAVFAFLDFHPRYSELARRLSDCVTRHATPVGSGTVARTQRIPIEKRAESAVIAWMRHQTTAYDSMKIARVKGERRKVRQQLAKRSKELLHSYRKGLAARDCPLVKALESKQLTN